MKIYMATDHAGFYLKEKIKDDLLNRGYIVEDFGAKNFDEVDDYPDFIGPCIEQYLRETRGDTVRGLAIVLGGSGTGEAICANRFRGARAVICNSENLDIIKLGRMHNNANVLSFGARFVTEKMAIDAVKIFQATPFEGGRHATRILKLDMLQ